MDNPNWEAIARSLKASIEARAAVFAAAPHQGYAAGYQPAPVHKRSMEIGSNQLVRVRSDLAAWMIGIATRELGGWEWHVDEALGGGAFLTIGRRLI